MKLKIYNRYISYCTDKKLTPFQQVLTYLITPEERNRLNEEVCRIPFPGNDTKNFNSRLTDEFLRPIVGAYINSISSLVELNLSFNKLGENGAFIVSKLLEGAENIVSFNMMGNLIGDNGSEKLAGSLKGKVNLNYFNLNTNVIGNVGVMSLNELLFTNPGITTFDIGKIQYFIIRK